MASPRILLVENDFHGAPIRMTILRRSGYEIGWITTVEQARTLLQEQPVPVEVLLVVLPGLEGDVLRFCEQAKSEGVSVMILGESPVLARRTSLYCEAYVQMLEGPIVWLSKLREIVNRRELRQRNASRSILNVDDNEFQRYATTRMLRHDGYRVLEAANGQKTLELALQRPDLIILDINLPDLSGFEVCRRLRRDPNTAAIPIMHLTGTFTSQESRAKGLANGADEYLCQPVEREKFLGIIESLLAASA